MDEPQAEEPSVEVEQYMPECSYCGEPMVFVDRYEEWFCESCHQYRPPEVAERIWEDLEDHGISCSRCHGRLEYVEDYGRWYCEHCNEYESARIAKMKRKGYRKKEKNLRQLTKRLQREGMAPMELFWELRVNKYISEEVYDRLVAHLRGGRPISTGADHPAQPMATGQGEASHSAAAASSTPPPAHPTGPYQPQQQHEAQYQTRSPAASPYTASAAVATEGAVGGAPDTDVDLPPPPVAEVGQDRPQSIEGVLPLLHLTRRYLKYAYGHTNRAAVAPLEAEFQDAKYQLLLHDLEGAFDIVAGVRERVEELLDEERTGAPEHAPCRAARETVLRAQGRLEALDDPTVELTKATKLLEQAKVALDEGGYELARELAKESARTAEKAVDEQNRARMAVRETWQKLSEARENGTDISVAEIVLGHARKALKNDDYDAVFKQTEKALRTASLEKEVRHQGLEEAGREYGAVIDALSLRGVDTAAAGAVLERGWRAWRAYDHTAAQRHFDEALDLAEAAKGELMEGSVPDAPASTGAEGGDEPPAGGLMAVDDDELRDVFDELWDVRRALEQMAALGLEVERAKECFFTAEAPLLDVELERVYAIADRALALLEGDEEEEEEQEEVGEDEEGPAGEAVPDEEEVITEEPAYAVADASVAEVDVGEAAALAAGDDAAVAVLDPVDDYEDKIEEDVESYIEWDEPEPEPERGPERGHEREREHENGVASEPVPALEREAVPTGSTPAGVPTSHTGSAPGSELEDALDDIAAPHATTMPVEMEERDAAGAEDDDDAALNKRYERLRAAASELADHDVDTTTMTDLLDLAESSLKLGDRKHGAEFLDKCEATKERIMRKVVPILTDQLTDANEELEAIAEDGYDITAAESLLEDAEDAFGEKRFEDAFRLVAEARAAAAAQREGGVKVTQPVATLGVGDAGAGSGEAGSLDPEWAVKIDSLGARIDESEALGVNCEDATEFLAEARAAYDANDRLHLKGYLASAHDALREAKTLWVEEHGGYSIVDIYPLMEELREMNAPLDRVEELMRRAEEALAEKKFPHAMHFATLAKRNAEQIERRLG